MDEKKYKRLVTIIIILLSIIILMVSYIIYDTVSNKKNLSNNEVVDKDKEKQEDDETKEEDFDLEQAKQLLENIEYTKFLELDDDDINLLKNAIAISKTQSQKATCDSIYNNIPGVEKYDDDYEISFDEVIMGCYDSQTHVVSYENANQTLKNLFGQENVLDKKDVLSYVSSSDERDLFGGYDYIDSINSFVYLSFRGDGYPLSFNVSDIKSAKLTNKQLTIEVYKKTLEQDDVGNYSTNINGNKVTLDFDADEKAKKDFVDRYSQYMEVHKFIFKLEDEQYVLKGYEK